MPLRLERDRDTLEVVFAPLRRSAQELLNPTMHELAASTRLTPGRCIQHVLSEKCQVRGQQLPRPHGFRQTHEPVYQVIEGRTAGQVRFAHRRLQTFIGTLDS